MIDIVETRVKELERLVAITPIHKAFTLIARLTEAKLILEMLEIERMKNVEHKTEV